MIHFNVPPFVGTEFKYMHEAVENHKICGDGPFTKKCDEWLENRFKAERVMLTTSGSTALDMAALLCGIKPGDEVILPSFTFSSTANSFVLAGATLVFVDIRPDTMNIDEEYFAIDLTIARGLDYYTGIVYETKLVDYPQIGSVCSGGRYDDLATYYTDKKLPGVGISIGLTRLFYQLKENGIINNEITSPVDVMILPMTEDYKMCLEVSKKIRELGISTSICYINKKFKSKIKYADNMNSKYAVIIGEDEINTNTLTIKNMVTGEQNQVKFDEIKEFFCEMV